MIPNQWHCLMIQIHQMPQAEWPALLNSKQFDGVRGGEVEFILRRQLKTQSQ